MLPNLAIIEELERDKSVEILYIGSRNGPEKELVERCGVAFAEIHCGKLRRYFDWRNFLDFFRFIMGIFGARKILKEFKPDLIFSKGGYVSLPVCIAAWILKIKLVVHESDVSPGLANRLGMRMAKKICLSFEESKKYLSRGLLKKAVVTGNPVRESVLSGRAARGFEWTGFSDEKPVILVMGGSQGAEQINNLVKGSLNVLLDKFQIIHVTGEGKSLDVKKGGYKQYEYIDAELKDVYAMADLVVTRGGANSLAELALLKKKTVVIPLSIDGSRGDQIENAKIFCEKFGWSMMTGNVNAREFADAVEMAFLHDVNASATVENGVMKIVEMITK